VNPIFRNFLLPIGAGLFAATAFSQPPMNGPAPGSEPHPGKTAQGSKDRERASYPGNILLNNISPRLAVHAVPDSLTIAYPTYLWPQVNGVATVYYVNANENSTDPVEMAANANIQTAINNSNADFMGVLQWVKWQSGDGSNYVEINLDSGDYSGECEALEGYLAVPAQPMTGSAQCGVGTILHEMGHIIGLWHEQSRADRNNYITVNYNNVIKGSWSNFDILTDNVQTMGLYDYASVMQYPPYSFTRNGGPVIETIPAGIPLSNAEGVPVPTVIDYSAGDKEAIERLYGAPPTQVTVTSNPVGLQVEVDGGNPVTTPQTYTWAVGSTHTLNVPSGVQSLSGYIENSTTTSTFYYTYGRWNDSTAQSHTITVDPGDGNIGYPATGPQIATYSANFIELVPYTSTVSPASTGTVNISPTPQSYSGANGQFFIARQQATLTAAPVSGWNFYEFNNGPFWLPGGLGANPKTFYVPDTGNPVDVTAEFSNTPVYTFDVTPETFSSNLSVSVDGGFAYTPVNFSHYYDYPDQPTPMWTTGTSHTVAFNSPDDPYSVNSRFAFSSWSDGGAASHTISSLPATSTSYIATVIPQFAPATNFSYPPCGGTGTLSTVSPTGDGFYPTGTQLSFSETPATGWTFAGWTYDLSGTAPTPSLTANDETLVFANFNTVAAPLTLTSVSPSWANAGGAGFTLTLTGTGFSPTSYVSVNGAYRTVTYVNAQTLQVQLTSTDIATPRTFQIFVENFPSGWDGCAVFGYQTFQVDVAAPATVSLSATSLSFGSLGVGSTSGSQTVTLTNTGGSALSNIGISITGAGASSYVFANSCGSSLAAGANCTIHGHFAPTSPGAQPAAITITDSATGSPQSIALSGSGVEAAAVSLSATSLSFGSVNVGSTSYSAVVTLTNVGDATLSIGSIAVTGANASSFVFANTCGSTLAAGANCTIHGHFGPMTPGALTAAITITDNAPGSPQSIALSGTGVAVPVVSLSATHLAFGSENEGNASGSQSVTLTNTGSATLSITSINLTGADASSFVFANSCGTTLAAGANCSIHGHFAPAAAGALTAAITITDNASGSPQSITLTGTGVSAGPAVSLTATSLSFGTESVGSATGSQTVTLTNSGGATLTFTSIAVTGTNSTSFVFANSCGTSLAAGANCTIHGHFAPTTTGALTAAITISDNASNSPQNIALSGTGQ